jgi:hypothetical protein
MSNPFKDAQAWDVNATPGGGILPPGDHRVTITKVNGEGSEESRTKNQYPQIVVYLENADGQARDWITVMAQTAGKIVQLASAAGIEPPDDSDVKADPQGLILNPAWLAKLVGKEVGIRMFQEPDRLDATKVRDRVQGYMPASEVAGGGSDIPAEAFGTPAFSEGDWGTTSQQPANAVTGADDDIPF